MKTVKKIFGLGLVLSTSAFAADEVNVNGYVATGFSYKNKGLYSFKFSEAAVYLTHNSGAASFMLDIPLMGASNGTSTAFAFASKGQAYVDYKYENGWAWRMGQFDSLYGFEGNDSVDRRFSAAGLINARMTPTVHDGVVTTYDMSESLKMQFIVANRFDVGQYTATPVRPDAGLKVSTKVSDFDVSLGGHMYQGVETSTSTAGVTTTKSKVFGKVGWLADFIASGNVAGTELGMELIFRQDPFTSGDKRPPAASGYLLQADYAMSEDMDLGAKFEGLVGAHDGEVDTTTYVRPEGALSDNVTFNKADRVRAFSFGPRFKMSKNMKVKADYTFWDNKNGDIKTKEHRLGVSVGYRF